MGYTHYWEFNGSHTPEQLSSAIAACNKIVRKTKVRLGDWAGGRKGPDLRKDLCRFNGYGDDAHETFSLSPETAMGFQFCKTAYKPYDLVVVACLVALKHHLGGAVNVTSDGENYDWEEGVALCNEVLGYGGDFVLGG